MDGLAARHADEPHLGRGGLLESRFILVSEKTSMNVVIHSRFWLVSLSLVMLMTATGCSLLTTDFRNLKEPKVSLAGLSVKDLNPLQPSFLVRLKLDNPNDLDVSLDGADVALALNGQPVAAGISRSPLTLKKLASSEMDLEVTANTLNAAQQFLLLQSKPTMDYEITGHLQLKDWMSALGRLPFSFQGNLDSQSLLRGVNR
jgi:LEA14-like dessication related protein